MIDFTPHQETIRSIGRIEQICGDIDNEIALMTPLIIHLMPLSVLDMKRGVSQEGKTVELSRKDWKQQYDKGVSRCMGYDILWV